MSETRITDELNQPNDVLEVSLRPSLFADFTGQAKVKERVEIAVTAAKQPWSLPGSATTRNTVLAPAARTLNILAPQLLRRAGSFGNPCPCSQPIMLGGMGTSTSASPPVIAAVASLSMLGFLGESISLFNIMALLLVLGIGVDYSLFFRETGTESPATLLAIALSSLTTLLAFGLLALSATTAIHAFGLTILVGILVAFFLSPMAGWGHDSTTEDGPTP